MQSFFAKYRWPVLVGLIIVGIGIFYWLSELDITTAPAPSTESSSTEVIAGNSTTTAPTPVEVISPLSPVSPVSPVSTPQSMPQTDPEVIQAMIDQALQAQQQGDYDRTIELTDQILADDPQNFIAYNLRGSAHMELGNTDDALADYSKAIELGPLFPHSFYNRGRLLRLQGKYDEAVADLEKSADLSPVDFGYRANGNIGLIYYTQGEYVKALAAFNKSISANVENKADVYYFRGETYTAMNNWEAAIQDYETAVERFANYAEAYRSLGYVYLRSGQLPQAEQALNKSLDIAADHPEAYLYLSLVKLADGQPNEAESSMQKAVSRLETLSTEQQKLALGRVNEAIEAFAKENPDKSSQVEQLLKLLPGQ